MLGIEGEAEGQRGAAKCMYGLGLRDWMVVSQSPHKFWDLYLLLFIIDVQCFDRSTHGQSLVIVESFVYYEDVIMCSRWDSFRSGRSKTDKVWVSLSFLIRFTAAYQPPWPVLLV